MPFIAWSSVSLALRLAKLVPLDSYASGSRINIPSVQFLINLWVL